MQGFQGADAAAVPAWAADASKQQGGAGDVSEGCAVGVGVAGGGQLLRVAHNCTGGLGEGLWTLELLAWAGRGCTWGGGTNGGR